MTRTCILFMAAVVPLGCSSLEMTSWFDRPQINEAGPGNPVVDIICIWQPGEGRGLDGLPARGFAGQMLFLTRGRDAPAKVNGDVRVYLFDDQGPPAEQSKPIHQFDFTREAFARYFYETKFGAAYQLFIPYTREGTHEAQCQLRVRFTPADGGAPIYSKMANVVLTGAGGSETRADRWEPETLADSAAADPAAEPRPLPDAAKSAAPLPRGPLSIPLPSEARSSRTDAALLRLNQLVSQLPDETTGAVEQASWETTEEATAPPPQRRFRLHAPVVINADATTEQ
jgi:hypothetical protein